MMFDDDDDGVEPQFKVVDKYYFEDGHGNDVCFSMLPFLFDKNENVESCNFNMEVYLRGLGDKRDEIHVKVVAWRIELEGDQPEIFVLSKDNWIRLLKPRIIHAKKVFGSILITVHMLHFSQKNLVDMSNNYNCLWSHLDEVFSKFDIKPTIGDLRQHRKFFMFFAKRDPILMNSEILQNFEGYLKTKKAIGTERQFIVDDEKGYKSNCGDTSDDDYNQNEDESNDDDDCSSDGHSDNDDGADPICAICDDGGKLLSCKGQCKRAFHPTKKHGRRSKCMTLGYTSTQRKEIVTFTCKNCKYEQHQCFQCGELEPSDEQNAKVFRCNNASCGHFYHPKCIAKLLEPDDTIGACELEERITAGMSFTCPVHWCFKCEHMEDKTESAFQLVLSSVSKVVSQKLSAKMTLKTKEHGVTTSGWEHRQINFFYCPDHIDKATKKVKRDHIKFPSITKTSKIRNLTKKKVKLTGKRKNNMDQLSTRSTEPSERPHQKDREHNQSVATKSSSDTNFLEPEYAASEQIILETESATKRFKEDMQHKLFGAEANADLSSLRAVEGLEKQSNTSFSVGRTCMRTSSIVGNDTDTDKRVTIIAKKEISSGVLRVSTKSVMPSSRNLFDHSIQENIETSGKNGHHCVVQNTVRVDQEQDIMLDKPLVEKDIEHERDNENSRISEDKDDNGSEETSDRFNEQNDVFDNLIMERHTKEDDCNIQSGKEKVTEWGKTASAKDPPSQPAESCRENPIFGNECEQNSRSYEDKIAMTDGNKSCSHDGGAWTGPSDDHRSEKQVHGADDYVGRTVRTDARQEFGCCENHEDDETRAGLKEPDSTHCNDNAMVKARERRGNKDGKVEVDTNRKYNHVENATTVNPLVPSSHQCLPNHKEFDAMVSRVNLLQCNDENRAVEISEDKLRMVPTTREELSMHSRRDSLYNSPLGGNAQDRSRDRSVEWQSMYYCDSFHVTNYQDGYEQVYHGDCSCIDYFTCRKYYPQLDYNGVIKYGGYHAMDVDPALRFSLQGNSNSAFRACTNIAVGGGTLYCLRNSLRPQASSAVSVTERYASNLGADPAEVQWVPRPPLTSGHILADSRGRR